MTSFTIKHWFDRIVLDGIMFLIVIKPDEKVEEVGSQFAPMSSKTHRGQEATMWMIRHRRK